MHYISSLIAIGLVCACNANSTYEVSKENCQRVREHTAELRLQAVLINSKVGNERAAEEMAKHKKNFSQAGGDEYLNRCVDERSSAWIECSLKSSTLQELEKC